MKIHNSKFRVTILTLFLLINFAFIACEENKVLTGEDTAQNNEGVNLVKADLSELIGEIEGNNPSLVALLKDNSASKLKESNLEKSKAFEFLFDTEHIMALRINKDHVIYMIPAYKSNNERDNNLYSVSININGNIIDTKLTTIEISSDGTQTNNTRKFNFSNLTSKNQTYATYVDMEIKCDCVASISDCTCHTSHASGGCDHPDVSINCSNCSGGSGISITNPSTHTNNNTQTSNNQIVAISNSSSGSNYGYTYSLSGNSVYIGLMKKYQPDYVFSALQKYNIINTPEISNPLLQFLDIDGSSQMNKDFALSIINAIEEGTVTTYQEFNVLMNTYKRTKEFVAFKNQFFKDHPATTEAQFENWFMGTSEGKDGDYDAAYWENPNLTFPQQNLPSFNDFYNAYPRKDGKYMKGADLFPLVGGEIYQAYINPNYTIRGACALKVSRALNYCGILIPNVPGTLKGADNKYYFVNAKALNAWMKESFGVNDINSTKYPYNSNHINYNSSNGGLNGQNYTQLLSNIKGIYTMMPVNPATFGASGHCDMIQENWCPFGCFFKDVEIMDIWQLN